MLYCVSQKKKKKSSAQHLGAMVCYVAPQAKGSTKIHGDVIANLNVGCSIENIQVLNVQGENQPLVGWLGGWLYPQPNRIQTTDFILVFLIYGGIFFSGR